MVLPKPLKQEVPSKFQLTPAITTSVGHVKLSTRKICPVLNSGHTVIFALKLVILLLV